MKQSRILIHALLLGAFALASTMPALAQGTDYFSDLPKGATPQEVGNRTLGCL